MYFCCVQPPKTKESTGEEESADGMWKRERKNVMEREWREVALLPTMILNFIEREREREFEENEGKSLPFTSKTLAWELNKTTKSFIIIIFLTNFYV